MKLLESKNYYIICKKILLFGYLKLKLDLNIKYPYIKILQFLDIYSVFFPNIKIVEEFKKLKLNLFFKLDYLKDRDIKNLSIENYRFRRDNKSQFTKSVDEGLALLLGKPVPKPRFFNPKGNRKYFVNKFMKFKNKFHLNYKSYNFGLYNNQFILLNRS
jgi:hypothetical protein